jgi:hypothetical protein
MPPNSSGWDKLRPLAETELEQLRQLLERHEELIAKCEQEDPNFIECSALATMLHSFYTGIENIFTRIAREIDGKFTKTENWHRDILQQMTQTIAKRPAAISEDLRKKLRDYLGFRHFFRNAYSFDYEWEKLRPLVLGLRSVAEQFDAELRVFMAKAPNSGSA